MFWVILTLGLIPKIMEEDNPDSFDAMTHTRPISKLSVALAKVLQVTIIGAFIPTVAEVVTLGLEEVPFYNSASIVFELFIRKLTVLLPALILGASFKEYPKYFISILALYFGFSTIAKAGSLLPYSDYIFPNYERYKSIVLLSSVEGLILESTAVILFAILLVLRFRTLSRIETTGILVVVLSVISVAHYFFSIALKFSNPDMPQVETEVSMTKINLKTTKWIDRKGNENTSYFFKPIFEASSNKIVRVGGIQDLAEIGGDINLENNGFSVPTFNGCMSESEIIKFLDPEITTNYQYAEPWGCNRNGASVLNEKEGKALSEKSEISLHGMFFLDIYEISKEFELSDLKSEFTSVSLTKKEYFNPFRKGYGHPQLIETGVIAPLNTNSIFPINSFREVDQNDPKLSIPPGFGASMGSDTSVVVSVLNNEAGRTFIEPLMSRSTFFGFSSIVKQPIYFKRYWLPPFNRSQLDTVPTTDFSQEASVIGLKVRYLGTKRLTLNQENIKIEKTN